MFGLKRGAKICPEFKAAKLSDIRCDTSNCAKWLGGECADAMAARALDEIAKLLATPSLRREIKIAER